MKRMDYMRSSVGPRNQFRPRKSPYSSPMNSFSPSPPQRQFDPFSHSTPRQNSPRYNNSYPSTPRFNNSCSYPNSPRYNNSPSYPNSPRFNNSSSQPNTPRNNHYSTNSSSDFIPLSDGSQSSGSGLGSWQSYHNQSGSPFNDSGQQRFKSGFFPKRRNNRQDGNRMSEQPRNIEDYVTPSILEDPWADLMAPEEKKDSK